ncbi:MAG: calcium/sodium antiporter [Nitrospinota bacterium]|nr:calcium/sodium antiporter [Nitrospinota bacterium]
MTLALISIIIGLVLLVWSADRFVEGSAVVARHFGVPPLLVGMLIIGFGTSAPEMVVSAIASLQGNPGLALGNAYGSNITNIALILGLTALIGPIAIHSQIIRRELPALIAVTGLTIALLWDGDLSRIDAIILLSVFCILTVWSIRLGLRERADTLKGEIEAELSSIAMSVGRAAFWLVVGLVILIASSRMLVWGSVEIARALGVSDLIIGLTIVAVGTSLPELASSLIAARKGEHDLAIGNVIGSNLFNTLTVVGIAGVINPMMIEPEVLSRDVLVMSLLTLFLFLLGYGFRGEGRVNRLEGGILLFSYIGYTAYLIHSVF